MNFFTVDIHQRIKSTSNKTKQKEQFASQTIVNIPSIQRTFKNRVSKEQKPIAK